LRCGWLERLVGFTLGAIRGLIFQHFDLTFINVRGPTGPRRLPLASCVFRPRLPGRRRPVLQRYAGLLRGVQSLAMAAARPHLRAHRSRQQRPAAASVPQD
jgi:hypothetical protein